MFSYRDAGGGHQNRNDLSSARTLTIPNNAQGVLLQAITQNIRFTLPGEGTPTASKGWELKAGDPTVFVGGDAGDILTFIEETTTAVLEFQYVSAKQIVQMQVK